MEKLSDHGLLLLLIVVGEGIHVETLAHGGLQRCAKVEVVVDDFSAVIIELIIVVRILMITASRFVKVLLFNVHFLGFTRVVLRTINYV